MFSVESYLASEQEVKKVIDQSKKEGNQPTGALVGILNEILQPVKEPVERATEFALGAPLRYMVNWGRLYSLWPVHIETACCSLEIGATAGAKWDMERFGILEAFGSLRQCDLMIVMGTITRKMAPRLKMVWEQMPEPKYCMAMGACAISGGLYEQSYNVLQGIDEVIPVDVYNPGCPPSTYSVMDAAAKLQEKIRHMDVSGNVISDGYKELSPKRRLNIK